MEKYSLKKIAKASRFGAEVLTFLSNGKEYFSFKELHEDYNSNHAPVEYKQLNKTINKLNRQGFLDLENRGLGWRCCVNSNGLRYIEDMPRHLREDTLPCRTHHLVFSMEIKRRGEGSFRGFRVSSKIMRNWKFPQLTKEYAEGVIMQTTDKTLMMRFKNVYGYDSTDAIFAAFDKVLELRDRMMREDPELVLGNPREISSVVQQHHALNIPEISQWMEKCYVRWTDDRLEIDKSKGYPELEFVHSTKAQDDWKEVISFLHAVMNGNFKWRDMITKNNEQR